MSFKFHIPEKQEPKYTPANFNIPTINISNLKNYISDSLCDDLEDRINHFLKYKLNSENECLNEIEKKLRYCIDNTNDIKSLKQNFKELYDIFNCTDFNNIDEYRRLKNMITIFKDPRGYYIKTAGGKNNSEYINYKFQNKVYRRKVRYEGKKKYIILNKIRVYIK